MENMSPEERKKYIESEKQGVKMRLLEARNFSQLNILHDRILKNIDDSLKDFLKKEFTNSFEKIFKKQKQEKQNGGFSERLSYSFIR